MLVLEDSDEDKIYFGKGLPRDWVGSGKEIKINGAPTRFGKVDFTMQASPEKKTVVAHIALPNAGSPSEIHVKFRLPAKSSLKSAAVNGGPATFSGTHGDTVVVKTGNAKEFEVVAQTS
jgi:hypothetical protein